MTAPNTSLTAPKGFIPLGYGDAYDGQRLAFLKEGWGRFDDLLRNYHRQIEENVRMLSGQQYSIYHPVLQRFLDPTEWMTEDERRWRQRPVFNRLLPWFIITHAKMTENPPILTFAPGPDRADAELAELMDIAQKTLWREMGMLDKHDLLMGWVAVAGRGHLLTRIDRTTGPIKKWVGQADLPMMNEEGSDFERDPNTGEPILQMGVPDVPHDKDGNPLAHLNSDGTLQITGEPHEEREGTLQVDVLSPLNCRGSWGAQPWYEKRVHYIRTFHTPEEVYDMTGMEIPPDVRGSGVADVGELERILYGTGFYGATDQIPGAQMQPTSTEGYVELTQRWERPNGLLPGMEQGRFTLASRTKLIFDGPRPAEFPYTSPLATFEFVRIPGRPGGTTPQEALNPVQRSYNDGYARIKEHVNISTNPKGVIDSASGIKSRQFTNAPGDNYIVVRRPGVPAIEFIAPPPLGEDVYKLQEMLSREFDFIGQTQSQKTDIPRDASGELIKELRFDDDRYLGATLRRAVEEYGRFIETWQVLLPLVWDEQKVLSYAGDDNVARTITVLPEMFKTGKVNVIPDVESMLPEGRGERSKNVFTFYNAGLLGDPLSVEAQNRFWELSNFPHLSRAAKPGGIDRTTAEQENGQLALGADPMTIPVFPWYNDDVHIMVHEMFMKSPEFKKAPPNVQEGFVYHWQVHNRARAMKQMQAAQAQAAMQATLSPPAPGGGGSGSVKPLPEGNPRSLAPKSPAPPRSQARMPTQLQAGIP